VLVLWLKFERYVAPHNRDPKPSVRTARASAILAKVTRAGARRNKLQSA